MIPQEKIEAHASKVASLAINLESQLSREVDVVVGDVSVHVANVMATYQGVIRQSSANARRVLAIEDVFSRSLSASGYYSTILTFVENFANLLDDFASLYEDSRLSSVVLTNEDFEILSHQAAAAISVLNVHCERAKHDLRRLLSRSLGESKVTQLVSEVCAIVRKTSGVGPMAKDQVNLWFRLLSSLVFRRMEEQELVLLYKYVGPKMEGSRQFCSNLLYGLTLTRGQVLELDNGQMPNVLLNAGGYGCNHFWFAEVAS